MKLETFRNIFRDNLIDILFLSAVLVASSTFLDFIITRVIDNVGILDYRYELAISYSLEGIFWIVLSTAIFYYFRGDKK